MTIRRDLQGLEPHVVDVVNHWWRMQYFVHFPFMILGGFGVFKLFFVNIWVGVVALHLLVIGQHLLMDYLTKDMREHYPYDDYRYHFSPSYRFVIIRPRFALLPAFIVFLVFFDIVIFTFAMILQFGNV